MIVNPAVLQYLSPEAREELHGATAKFSDMDVGKLDSACARLVEELRGCQKAYHDEINLRLSDLDAAMSSIEAIRNRMEECRSVISGHEKIIGKYMKELKKTRDAGDSGKSDALEGTIRKQTRSYRRTMKEAAKISTRMEDELAGMKKIMKRLKAAGETIPDVALDLKLSP